VNLAPSWAAKLRQWWDELFTGRAERTLFTQAEEWKAEAYRWRAKCEQMERAIMPIASIAGARYIASMAPAKSAEPAKPAVPQTWAEMQSEEYATSVHAEESAEPPQHSQNAAAIGR
jgi:phage tail sheath gpL-like